MPDQTDVMRALKPKLHRLKELGEGIRVGRVIGDRVLVKTVVPRTELDEYKKKGLYIPEKYEAEYTPLPTTGVVLAVGDAVATRTFYRFDKDDEKSEVLSTDLNPMTNVANAQRIERTIIREGDLILFPRLAGMDFTIAGEDLRIIHTKEILCVLEETEASVYAVNDVPAASVKE